MRHHIPIPCGGGRSVNIHDTAIQELPECGWSAVETSARHHGRRELYVDAFVMTGTCLAALGAIAGMLSILYTTVRLVGGATGAHIIALPHVPAWLSLVLIPWAMLLLVVMRIAIRRIPRPRTIELPWDAGIEGILTEEKRDALFAAVDPSALLERYAVDAVLADAESKVPSYTDTERAA